MEFLILAFEALKERRLRSALTILMVIVGVTLLVGVEGVSKGTQRFIEGEFEKFGTNIVVVIPTDQSQLIDDYIADDIKEMDGVLDVVPAVSRFATISAGGREKTVMVVGIELEKLYLLVPELSLKDGVLPSETDYAGVVLGHKVAYNPDGTKFVDVGEAIRITYAWFEQGEQKMAEKSFVVRGIFKGIGSYFIPIDEQLYLPLRSAKKFFEADEYDHLYIITVDDKHTQMVADEVSNKYGFNTLTPQMIKETVDTILGAINMYILAISVVSLMVASIGIITTLYTSMLERIREIGVLKAIGFKKRHILKMFLYEALIIGIIGAIVGMIMGVILSYALKSIFFPQFPFINPYFTIDVFIISAVVAIGFSLVSGLYPAWRASKLDPVVALRYE